MSKSTDPEVLFARGRTRPPEKTLGGIDATHEYVDRQVAGREGFLCMEGDLQRTVGRNLRAYRQAHGFSQEAFADVLGVHRTYMGGVERGERNLTLRSVERIAEHLDLDPLVLLAPEGRPSSPTAKAK